MKDTFYFFEIYTKDNKGNTGAEIEIGFVKADTRQFAITKIKNKFGKKFDEIIQCHESNLFDTKCKCTLITD